MHTFIIPPGAAWLPVCVSLRLLVAIWWFYAIIMAATFTGNLIAAITVPKVPPPIQTLEELSQQTLYTAGVVDGTALYDLFRVSFKKDFFIMHTLITK